MARLRPYTRPMKKSSFKTQLLLCALSFVGTFGAYAQGTSLSGMQLSELLAKELSTEIHHGEIQGIPCEVQIMSGCGSNSVVITNNYSGMQTRVEYFESNEATSDILMRTSAEALTIEIVPSDSLYGGRMDIIHQGDKRMIRLLKDDSVAACEIN